MKNELFLNIIIKTFPIPTISDHFMGKLYDTREFNFQIKMPLWNYTRSCLMISTFAKYFMYRFDICISREKNNFHYPTIIWLSELEMYFSQRLLLLSIVTMKTLGKTNII